jgi:acetylornithine aminotransferase
MERSPAETALFIFSSGFSMSNTLMKNYAPLAIEFSHGEGPWLYDANGERYLDAVSGVAVCSLGHAHPAVAEALCEQARTLLHTSNLYQIHHQQALADKLAELSGMESAFFCNSGAEANEAAIKLARLHARSRQIESPHIIVTENSFHGRTLATLSATGNPKVHAGFEPLVEGFIRVPYGDSEAIRAAAADNPGIVAVLVEPVQGEGGVNIAPAGYLEDIRSLCDENNWLMMLDEIQTGICRTGEWFGFQHTDISPDVMTLAKALGNGMPIGACLARGDAASLFQPGSHGSTFGGNPLASRAALAVIDVMTENGLDKRAAELGQRFLDGFRSRLATLAGVNDIRGQGLLLGIELDRPCAELVQRALEQKLLINVTAGNVVRLLPPLVITDDEADDIIDRVSSIIESFLA